MKLTHFTGLAVGMLCLHMEAEIRLTPDSYTNHTGCVASALDVLRPGERIVFEKGEYHFYPEGCRTVRLNPSNNSSGEKHVAFYLKGLSDVVIDGGGSVFIFHDDVFPFALQGSTNVVIRNISIKTSIPPYTVFTVLRKGDDGFELKLADGFEAIPDIGRHACFHSLDREFQDYCISPKDSESRDWVPTKYLAGIFECVDGLRWFFRYHPEENDRYSRCRFNIGERVCLNLAGNRERIFCFAEDCVGLCIEDLTLTTFGGMGVVAQRTHDVDVRRLAVRPSDTLPVTLTADAMHFINCSGNVCIEDCEVAGTLDDVCNVHGNYLRVDSAAGRTVVLQVGHFEQAGFFPYRKGDDVEFVSSHRRDVLLRARVESFEKVSDTMCRLTVDRSVADIPNGALVEDVTLCPNVIMRRNWFHDFPHIRLSGRGRIVVEENLIERCDAGIIAFDLAEYWYESGRLADFTVRSNIFENCSSRGCNGPYIRIGMTGYEAGHGNVPLVHGKVRLYGNKYLACAGMPVQVFGVEDMVDDSCINGGDHSPIVSVASPDGRNVIRLWQNPLSYDITRDGVHVVSRSEIGLEVDGRALMPESERYRIVRRAMSGTLPMRIYNKSNIDLASNEAFVDFADWGIRACARNDGVAYRFETRMKGNVRVDDEKADVCLPSADAVCWVNFTGSPGCEETTNATLVARDIKTSDDNGAWDEARRLAYLPFSYTISNKTVCVTESDVCDYPIWNLTRADDADTVVLHGAFARWPTVVRNNSGAVRDAGAKPERHWIISDSADYLVETSGSRTFPWRTFVLTDAPMSLIEADIVTALARPQDMLHDFSWVRPGRVAWDWWNAFDNKGDPAGCTTEVYRRFIDFAAKYKVEYVILDEGWSEKLNIWKFSPKVDVPFLIDYAYKKGVGIILWMAWAQIDGDEDRVAAHFARLGAKGFKVDFIDRGDAASERFIWAFAEACRKHNMILDYHGVHRPTGMSRCYPNILNYEGIRGLEMMKFYHNDYDFLDNDIKEMFCRMVAGPADYTPGAMDNYVIGQYKGTSDNPGSIGTRCRQLAMMILYEAPLQMLCDAPSKYEKNTECLSFMVGVPLVWSDTKALAGTPDTMACVARRSREGIWYAAGMTNSNARRYVLNTDFLAGGDWRGEIFCDACDSDVRPMRYVHEFRTLRAGDTIDLDMAPGGGFVVRFSKISDTVAVDEQH